MARSPAQVGLDALDEALRQVLAAVAPDANPAIVRRVRAGLAAHAVAVEAARGSSDPVATPRQSFDPSDPKTVGRMVSIALLAQPRVPLAEVRPAYGSGVYAIYYTGDHPLYRRISGTETPIYVGKADPTNGDASTSREQGPRLTGRLIEHAGTIATAEAHASAHALAEGLFSIALADFVCRRLVCATNAQLVAERHLIRTFWPVWNSDTKACWGMSKHGDAATTRRNKRSPWDVVHPGRGWALDDRLEDSISIKEIDGRVNAVFDKYPPEENHAVLLEAMLLAFRQDDGEASVAASPPLAGATGERLDEAGGPDDD